MNLSPYDVWRLGLDEPEEAFCTPQEFKDNLQALDYIEQAAAIVEDPDVRALLEKAAGIQREWLDLAEYDGCGDVPDEEGEDDDDDFQGAG